MEPQSRPATLADLEALPAEVVGEIIAGELLVSPRPSPFHALAAGALQAALMPPFHYGRGGPGGWWILPEPELRLSRDVVVPELGGWRRERLPGLPESGAAFTLAPDWACEILSPATAKVDRKKKLPVYARERVAHVWLIDPDALTLEVFRLEAGAWRLAGVYSDDDRVRAEPFEAFELDLLDLWEHARTGGAPP